MPDAAVVLAWGCRPCSHPDTLIAALLTRVAWLQLFDPNKLDISDEFKQVGPQTALTPACDVPCM